MFRILKIEGFSKNKTKELFKKGNESYPRHIVVVKNFLNSIENSFTGYWKVYGDLHNEKQDIKLKRLGYLERFDESAWILLPEDLKSLLERLVWIPLDYVKLKEEKWGFVSIIRK